MKKKKYNLLILPALLIVAFAVFSGFTVPDEEQITEKFVLERAEIFQQVYAGFLPPDEGTERLEQIETDSLLTQDTDKLQDIDNRAHKETRSVHVRSITPKKEFFKYNTYEVWMEWEEKSGNNWSEIDRKYNVVLKKTGKKAKLSIFDQLKENFFE